MLYTIYIYTVFINNHRYTHIHLVTVTGNAAKTQNSTFLFHFKVVSSSLPHKPVAVRLWNAAGS